MGFIKQASIKQEAEDKTDPLPCLLVPENCQRASSQNVSKHPIQTSHLSHSSNHWWAFRSTLAARRRGHS